jgi:hypothetical protein
MQLLLPQISGSHLERLRREIPIHGLTSNNHAKCRKAFLCIQIHLTSRQTTLYSQQIPSEKSTHAAPLRKNWWFRKKDSAMWKEACKFDSTAHATYSLSLHFATHQYPPFVLRKCYSRLKGNQEEEMRGRGGGIMMQLDQVFLPPLITKQCVLYPTNCPVDLARIWSVESPELLAVPRKRALFLRLDQLYPQ